MSTCASCMPMCAPYSLETQAPQGQGHVSASFFTPVYFGFVSEPFVVTDSACQIAGKLEPGPRNDLSTPQNKTFHVHDWPGQEEGRRKPVEEGPRRHLGGGGEPPRSLWTRKPTKGSLSGDIYLSGVRVSPRFDIATRVPSWPLLRAYPYFCFPPPRPSSIPSPHIIHRVWLTPPPHPTNHFPPRQCCVF